MILIDFVFSKIENYYPQWFLKVIKYIKWVIGYIIDDSDITSGGE